jgi:paired small multidrug resistance pump
MEFHDFVGFSGAIAILLAYFFLQAKRMSADGLIYSLLNLVGALLILFSLASAWNSTAVFIEIIWVGISLYGIFKWYKTSYAQKIE